MSKAVLVIDMPKRCKDCFRYRADPWFGGSCTQVKDEDGWNKQIAADDEYSVQSWCPLRPHQEAIPIEWLRIWEEKHKNDPCYCNFVTDEILADWEKENGRSE